MSFSEPPSLRRALFRRALVACLLGATFALPAYLMTGKSITNDEVAHIPAGYSYLLTGIVRVNPMHPPLVKEICALPLLFLDAELPIPPRAILEHPGLPVTFQWEYGRHFLERPELDTILFRSRLMAVLLSLGLGAVILIWARALWGNAGAALALSLYAFDPTITAHSQLVTTDVGVAFFSTAYLFSLRRFTLEATGMRLLVAGLTLGLALGAKFSAVFLLPITALLLGLAISLEPHRFGRGSRWRASLAAAFALLTMACLAYAVLWVIYFFPRDPFFYLHGLRTVNLDRVSEYPFFLMGELKPGGWAHYLLIAFLVKTPLPTLLLLAASITAFASGRRDGWLEEAFLLVPAIGLFAAYSAFSDPLGVRYVIPCFPFLFLFAARFAPIATSLPALRPIAAGLFVWLLVEYISIWPDHLSYFNQ
ncbi:MAG: ArnT family glycosyltransferase, partial [Candidatus Binatia bacterium]